ncbi:GNAT family N-acetyltransferase [Ramlibacter humi]|uniref:GNAT family N-acetyltransferase n=1 Tax=Ramlibacter humi TaxID=2530451 RepID=A0A4Z0C7S2_9BURK|nr:GNAT family N-acetyltransferase [Ramlibacter humi]TFZ07727.1 GNAT family N-acetyltransferase [Ramlibacter humi]
MSTFTIRPAAPADADTLAGFNIAMAFETEHRRLIPEVVGRGVRRMLDQPSMGFYLVAERAGAVMASAMVTTEWSDWRDGRFWWLQSVYVRPEARRQGAFRALYEAIRERAMNEGDVCGFRLYVEKDNEAAMATYRSLGMAGTDYRVMEELRPGVVYLQPGN